MEIKALAKDALNRFARTHRGMLRGVRSQTIELYLKELLDAGLAPATVNRHFRYLHAAFEKAIKRGYLGVSPMEGLKQYPEGEKEIRIITDDEEKLIFDKANEKRKDNRETDRWYAYLWLLLHTGARRNELFSVKWDDIDLNPESASIKYISDNTKSYRTRIIPLDAYPEIIKLLAKIKKKYPQNPGPWAHIKKPGAMTRRWGRMRVGLGLKDVTLHDFRRTAITRWIKQGIDLPVVQKLSGHTNINVIINYYNKVMIIDLREAMRKMAS